MSRENFLIVLTGIKGSTERINPTNITRISTVPATDKAPEGTMVYMNGQAEGIQVKELATEIVKKGKSCGVLIEL